MAKFNDELKQWRKVIQSVLSQADRPCRLDAEYTRGKYGIVFDPLPSGLCEKHRVYDKDGKYDYTINNPFCPVCFPEAHVSARRGRNPENKK